MILAALGDIHGNWPAFKAVLRVLDDAGVQTILNTGECVVGHSYSNEVIDCLRDRKIVSTQGQCDRHALRFDRKREQLQRRLPADLFASVEAAYAECRSENIEFLRGLRKTRSMTIDGVAIALCHGTLADQARGLKENDSAHLFRRQREIVPADIFVFGNTHAGFSRTVDDALFVNPGSVGCNNDNKRLAEFAIVNAETKPWSAELRSIEY